MQGYSHFREPTEGDVGFILNSWLKSSRDVGERVHMTNPTFYGGYRDECCEKIKRGYVTIACDPEDPDHIFGWLCWAPPDTVHYVYVKHPYRKKGLAKSLIATALPAGVKTVTTVGRFHREWAPKYKLEYDPYSWMSRQATSE